MLESIRKSLKDDLWKIIDNEELQEKDLNNFLYFVFYLFLEHSQFAMNDVVEISKDLKEKYYEILNESKDLAISGDPIKAIKNIDEKFVEKIKPIIENLNCK